MCIGERIHKKRLEANLTLKELAKKSTCRMPRYNDTKPVRLKTLSRKPLKK